MTDRKPGKYFYLFNATTKRLFSTRAINFIGLLSVHPETTNFWMELSVPLKAGSAISQHIVFNTFYPAISPAESGTDSVNPKTLVYG
jgi:hypothetical protein